MNSPVTDPMSTDVRRIGEIGEIASLADELCGDSIDCAVVLIGGASAIDTDLEIKLKPFFNDVLAKWANQNHACVIDGGTDAGVMRLIGQARAATKSNFPLIGVVAEETVELPGTHSKNEDAAKPEPNHSHLIIVPGSNWGDESKWIGLIATAMGKNIPTFTVLVNGGETSRRDIELSLASQRPVMAVRGSGRLADEIAEEHGRDPEICAIDISIFYEEFKQVTSKLLSNQKGKWHVANFEEYKLFVESTQLLTVSRHKAQQLFLSIIAALFTVISPIFKDSGLKYQESTISALPLFVVGMVLSGVWYVYIIRYKTLIGLRYKVLEEMENSIPNSVKMYQQESPLFSRKKGLFEWGFSALERWLPIIFFILFLIYGLVPFAVTLGWI